MTSPAAVSAPPAAAAAEPQARADTRVDQEVATEAELSPPQPLMQSPEEVIARSPLFDAEAYRRTYGDVDLSGLSPAAHYLRVGARLGRDPAPGKQPELEPVFDSEAYLRIYRDVAGRGDVALLHYERYGRGEGRLPAPVETTPETAWQVDVVVPVYNALSDVTACLQSLAEAPVATAMRVIVVNDGSDAETTAYLRRVKEALSRSDLAFEVIEHDANLGYTRAVNAGLKRATAPYIVTLNSDTIVTPGWADSLIRCLNSDPDLGIAGPLSNAASWQNVPQLYGADGRFAINTLEQSVEDMARIVRFASRRSYPRSPFVNGFCFMIRHAVLQAVGYMDEATFPTGYGEENDFCMRAQDAGFGLAIADDTFVFHAKSRSFGQARRDVLARRGDVAIRAKHGDTRFDALLARVARTAAMDEVRARIGAALADQTRAPAAQALAMVGQQRILFVLPVRGGGGGVHSIVQEVAAMRAAGTLARVAVRRADLEDYLRLYADIPDQRDLFLPFTDATLTFLARDFDVAVATIFTSVPLVARITQALPWVLPAYYAQDYEPMFFDEGSPRWQEARDSYTALPGAVIFAKTHWIGRVIEENHGMPVQKVSPSLDHSVYNLNGPRLVAPSGQICITAMIRPKTPRRGAERTMQLLARLAGAFGSKVAVHLFGSETDTPDFQALTQGFSFINHGVLRRPDVAGLLRSTDLFVDLSDYQAFGRTGLEAMACGALAVGPEAGGGWEYAAHGINALVVDSYDIDACFDQIAALLQDPDRLARMRFAGIETAAQYSPHRAALSEQMVLAPALQRHRSATPAPEGRGRLALVAPRPEAPDLRWPSLASERWPGPFCQTTLVRDWQIGLTANGDLPVPGSADIAIMAWPVTDASPTEDVELEPDTLEPDTLEPDTEAAGAAMSDGAAMRMRDWSADWHRQGGRLILDAGRVPVPQDLVSDLAACADLITVSTAAAEARLVAQYPDCAGRIRVLPDYVDHRLWDPVLPKKPPAEAEQPLRIGIFGTHADAEALAQIQPGLGRAMMGTQMTFEIVGVYQGLPSPFGRRVSYPGRVYETPDFQEAFITWLRQVAQWDIILVPDVADCEYHLFRAAMLGGAIVGGAKLAQSRFARHRVNGLFVGSEPEAWAAAITELAGDAALRKSLAAQARAQAVADWSLEANASAYLSVLEQARA